MGKEQLNSLVIAYKSDRGADTFRAIYDVYEPIWKRTVYADSKRACTDSSTMYALYQDALMSAIAKWDSALGDFANYLNRWINRAKSNLQRTNLRRMRNLPQYTAIAEREDEDAPTSDIEDEDYKLEDHVYERMHKKKEADKIALIDSLLESVTDSVTITVVTNFPRYKSVNDLAKGLGIHHETVKRKLTALSRRFDANRFGDITDYLAV